MTFFTKLRISMLLLAGMTLGWHTAHAADTNPEAITSLLDRIGGTGTADRFVTTVDTSLNTSGKDVFIITSQDGKPCIKGSSVLAVTTGINWYLNHTAHVNLTWNNLTTDLSSVTLPTPSDEEKHVCQADYRYYLNYCTFSYSMSTWTWERWQQEIDWMALHGINMPLQIVGLDVVWKNLLTKDLGYTSDEANDFIAGPCFQAWWGMNNLQGWGGPNPDWWYTRQESLAKKILERERELGMQPVLPGYAGMVPSDIASKGYTANSQGNWCYFVRPYILDPNSTAFADISEKYYQRLEELMGTSEYYSMDPFHEGANTDGIDVASAYSKIATAMTNANSDAKWVIQFWQWSSAQYNVLSQVSKGKLIVLDLFSDAHTHFDEYNNHNAIYCMLPNFGGRTGLFGRLTTVMTDYYSQKNAHSNLKGIGATPEAIEQVPVLYDALFELPWRSTKPDPQTWLADYATSRYGTENAEAQAAWEIIRNSALNCETSLQGPHEAVLCARPALQVGSVSSWGGTDIFYDAQDVASAAWLLLSAKESLSGENYSYDLTDFTRQALTDYGYYLLKAINSSHASGDETAYAQRCDTFLQLILDLDKLLSTNKNFMLGRWTQMARAIADEASGTDSSDREWLELDNARTLITTWGGREQSESGGLRDYSYREWGGMMKDFYYPRWKIFFENLDNGSSQPDWFDSDWAWAHNASLSYSDQPAGNTAEVAEELSGKYFLRLTLPDGGYHHIYRHFDTDARSSVSLTALRGETFTCPVATLPDGVTATIGADLNNDGQISDDETTQGLSINIPATAVTGKVTARLTLSDGTEFSFTLIQKDIVTTPRTVSVVTADSGQGSASIEGASGTSVTGTDDVTIKATANAGYDFLNWTDGQGNVVSTDNPYTYYGAEAATFTANFVINKWGTPTEDLSEISTIESYGQYLTSMTVTQNGGEEQSIYSATSCPSALFQTTSSVNAPQGSKFSLHWKDAGGLNYCRLSAYIDLNSDGDFEDSDELLAVLGEKSSAENTMLNDYTLDVLLPYDVPEGVTHVRLRFDGAWQTGQDSSTGAMPAKAKTLRMVYDVPVLITTQSATACTVTVKSADTAKGTVDANGQPDTYTYGAGEEVVLRCYPSDGYELQKWTDQYGREVPSSWRDGLFLRFHAPESGTYTAHFATPLPETVSVDDWTFSYSVNDEGLTLQNVVTAGGGQLNIPSQLLGYNTVAIAPGALQGQSGLTSITIPSSMTDVGTSLRYSGSFKGAGETNATIIPDQTIGNTSDWQMDINVTTDGSSFNEWGSTLLATGSEALGNSYDGGFQLYLKADGSIVLKMGSSEVKTFTNTSGASTFNVTISHTAAGAFEASITANGTTDTYSISTYALNDITTLCTALPTGINLTSITITDPTVDGAPFRGCSSLAEISVENGNKKYKATSNVLYTADGTRLVAFPEGRLSHTLNLPAVCTTIGSHAFTSAPNLERIASAATTPATAEKESFEIKTVYAQPLTARADAFRAAWGLPILFKVSATATLSDENAAKASTTDAVELVCDGTSTGTAPSLASDVPLWLSRTCLSTQLYPVYFPTAPQKVSVEGFSTNDTPVSSLRLFSYIDGTFVPVSSPSAGAYLMTVPTAWSGRQIVIRFNHSETAILPVSGFSGNGTTDNLSVTTGCYDYDSVNNIFSYNAASPSLPTLSPFEAVLAGYEGCPATIKGPDFTTGINELSDPSRPHQFFSPDGKEAQAHSHGVLIRDDGQKMVK